MLRGLLLAAALSCLGAQAAFAQAAYIRPLSPPPEKPAHGFYVSSIQLVPEDLSVDNGMYTVNVEVRMENLPSFSPNAQAMNFTIPHVKATGTIQQLRDQVKKTAEGHFDEIIGTFKKYRGDFETGKH